MLKRVLTYLVLALVVVQSAVVEGDIHQLHQSGMEHHVFDGAHLLDNGHISETPHNHSLNSELPNTEKWDCHHCCHCHGHFCAAAIASTDRVDLAKFRSTLPEYTESTFPQTYETFLRPPISQVPVK